MFYGDGINCPRAGVPPIKLKLFSEFYNVIRFALFFLLSEGRYYSTAPLFKPPTPPPPGYRLVYITIIIFTYLLLWLFIYHWINLFFLYIFMIFIGGVAAMNLTSGSVLNPLLNCPQKLKETNCISKEHTVNQKFVLNAQFPISYTFKRKSSPCVYIPVQARKREEATTFHQ